MENVIIANSGDLKLFFELVREVSPEAVMVISPEEMNIRTLDAGNCMMVDVTLAAFKSNFFTEEVEVGINVEEMYNALNTIKGLTAVMTLLDGRIQLSSGKWKVAIRTYDVTTLPKRPGIPKNMDLPNVLKMADRSFADVLKSISSNVDKVRMRVTNDAEAALVIESHGSDTEWSVGFNDYEEMEVLGRCNGCSSIFSADYLKSIGKALAKVQDITVKLGLDQPIVVSGSFQDGDAIVQYFLAPRIEST